MGEKLNYGHYTIPKFLNSTTKIVAFTAILYFIFAQLSLYIFVTEIKILPFFPAIGFAMAATLLLGRKVIFGVAIGCLLFSISLYQSDFQNATTFEEFMKPLTLCIVRPIIVSLNTFLVSYFCQLWCKKNYPFDSEKNVIFFVLACLLGTFISVSIGFIPLAMTSYFPLDNCILTWSNMLRGNALGAILFTPFVLSWFYDTKEFTGWPAEKKAEVFLLIVITLSLSLYVFETRANNESILYFLLLWAANRYGMKIITLVVVIIAIIAIYFTGHNMGGFVFSGWNIDFCMLQLFLFVNMVSVLFLKAILDEKTNKGSELKISEQSLNLKNAILQATIESPNGISISSLDTNLNYLSFNSTHANYMKKEYGVEIEIGKNHIEYITKANRKEEINSVYQTVLKGNPFFSEEKDDEGGYWKIHKSPIKNREGNIIGVTTIVTNVTELKLKEIQLENNNLDLNERVKELNCLYTISEIFRDKTLSKSEKLEACIQIIPKGMQYPEITNCRIQLKEKEFVSANYQKNECFIHQLIIVNGEDCGSIEVGYFDEKNLKKKYSFLDEEFKLIEALSGIISKAIESKLAEEKLLKSEEKYRSIFENTQDVYYMHNLDGKIFEVSPSCEKHFKYTREEMIGIYTGDLYYDPSKQMDFKEKIVKNGYLNDEHMQFVTATGEPVYFSVNCKIIFDKNGAPSHIEGSMRNINERLLNQQQLIVASEKIKESEEKFRSIYENMQDVYFMHELDGKLIDISPSVEKNFTSKRENIIGLNVQSFYCNPARFDELTAKILEYGFLNDQEVQFLTSTGETVYFSVSARLIKDRKDNRTLVEGTMRNVNERIVNQRQLLQATDKIKRSEEKFRSIYENSVDIYFQKDLKGIILEISPSVEKHLQYKQEFMIGKNIDEFYLDPSIGDRFYEIILKKQQIYDYEEQFITATGQSVYFSVNAKLVYDSNGEPVYVEGTKRNINERIVNQNKLLDATEKIKKSEENFRSLFDNMPDIYYMHTFDGKIFEVSPAVEKHLKYKREEIIGTYTFDHFYDPSKQQEFRENLMESGYLNDKEIQYVTATGEPVYFSVNARVMLDRDGKPSHIEGSMRNINERIINQNKLLEASDKIKQSEEEFRSIFESFEDMYFKTSLEGLIQNVSPSIEKMLKFKREEVINTSTSNLYLYAEDRIKVVEVLNQKGHINDFETVFKDRDNNPVHLSVNAHLVYDSKGEPIYIEGTIRDISERKNNELKIELANQAIKESEQKYRTIFESVRDVFFRASTKDHKIIDISPSCSYFGVEPQELIGKSLGEFYLNPEDRIPVLNELSQNGELNDYTVQVLINSKIYTVSTNSKISYDENNEPEFQIGSFRDVSDRVQAEENLKVSEAKFRSIFENFEDVYFRTTMDGKVIDVSPSFEKNFLKPCSFALENSVFDFYYDKEDRESLLDKLKKEGQVKDFDARFRDGEENIVFFSVNARLIYDENGEPIFIEKSMRNINDRIAFQKEMLTKNRMLEFQNTELEQFAYIASHDLQEPLITVIQCIEMLQEELDGNLDEDQKQYLQFVVGSTARMHLLVKGLLDYSRIGKERQSNSVDCNEIVAHVLADMDASLKESNALIECENLPTIKGNATEMRQLFQNLISNANKFRKKEEQPKIKIEATKEENNWLFSIEDNGIGIEEHDKDKVFVIFKRLNNRNKYQGTGIGLSHCKKIIEHHKGKIWVESKFNEGSKFKWTLPLEESL